MRISKKHDSAIEKTKVGILGAGGYLGGRLMRVLQGNPHIKAVGIVRAAKSLARLSNVSMEIRIVNTSREADLTEALSGCDTAVNAVNGDVSRVLMETQTAYRGALAAGCQLFIHLSSAVVFGRAESSELNDDSHPEVKNWMLYARGKSEGELFLKEMLKNDAMRVVVLRPGLIWGPGSQWSGTVGEQLSRGSVCLSNAGRGIANLMYVDNLVQMILAVHQAEKGPSGFYNVGDQETVTWSQYYNGLGKRLGYPETDVRAWGDSRLPFSPKLAMEWCLQRKPLYRIARWCLPKMGLGLKGRIKKLVKGEPRPPDGLQATPQSPPRLSREHWALQNTSFRLPTRKFFRDYRPVELESFEGALDATASWLRFAGYAASQFPDSTNHFDCSHLW